MLEITGRDIKKLNDSDLRSLVGLLCEGELRLQGLPTAGVTWGGDQRAADGGIDVKVSVESKLKHEGYIPRGITGYQVKEPDMPPSAIINEMRPDGVLRSSIKNLAELEGAYIIVSSNSSTSDSALNNRKQAMQEALSDFESPGRLKIDFYDCVRIASWVRSHPSLILWVRQKIGNPIQGWQPYDNWANAPGGIKEDYILDDEVRLYDGSEPRESGMKGVEAINKLRSKLLHPGSSIRLTGLSGVGKTRFVQALFDDRIGENPLNPTQVFYSDVGDEPIPSPKKFAEQIISFKKKAILVIDNCSPELHRRLHSVCSGPQSLISLLTVEYDVRDDQPEETEVFLLEPASLDLIEKMVGIRFKHVSQVDARTIAEFSGGNARIAIALSDTVTKGETLADLKDQELFKRLFYQRNDPDNQLLRSAEICSLVYSFDIRTEEGANIEMLSLSKIAGKSLTDLYGDIAELKRRQLVQQRNYWRAVLPHAIANRLAKRALENIPINIILDTFNKKENERLLISFSRRLGYLHDSEIAIQIAEKWLAEDGLLGDISNLNSLGIDMLKNIAPVKPEATLSALEHAAKEETNDDFTSRLNSNYVDITRLLSSLAYESELFDRSVELLVRFALSEKEDENVNSIRNQLKSLFLLYLSGTHATDEQRLDIIRKLISSKSERANKLGLELLKATLQTSHFTSFHQFDFGARSRDTGFWPKNREEILGWYRQFVNYTVEIAISEKPISKRAKLLLAESFRGLWTNVRLYDELENAAEQILEKGSWKEGWVGIQKTIRFNRMNMGDDVLSRLEGLGDNLKPTSLLDRARLYAFSKDGSSLELPDTVNENEIEKESDRYRLIGEAARTVGKEVAQNEEILSLILPGLIKTDGAWSFNFGKGLADGISDSEGLWDRFKSQLAATDENKRSYRALSGFLYQLFEIDPKTCNRLLDVAVADDTIGIIFPYLQASIKIDKNGLERLFRALESGIAPIYLFKNLAYGKAHESINDDGLSDLLKAIASNEDGMPVAIEILHMRFFGIKHEEYEPTEKLINVGRELLENIELDRSKKVRSEDYTLSEIIKVCFKGESADNAAQEFCTHLARAITEHKVFSDDYTSVYEALIQVQPMVFLNSFYGEKNDFSIPRLVWNRELRSDPLSKLDQYTIIEWCEENPSERYPIMARVILPFQKDNEAEKYKWTELAIQMMNKSPEPEIVLNNFKAWLFPSTWTPPLSSILQTRLPLISDLKNHDNPAITDWAFSAEIAFEKEIQVERQREAERDKARQEEYGFE